MNKEELHEWKKHPITEEVFKMLENSLDGLKQDAIDLGGIEDSSNQLAQLKGRYDALSELINMEVD